MQTHSCKQRQLIAYLCIITILLSTLLALPHEHSCMDTDCITCAILETFRAGMIWVVLSVCLYPFLIIIFHTITHHTPLSRRESTPVGLKVKISD